MAIITTDTCAVISISDKDCSISDKKYMIIYVVHASDGWAYPLMPGEKIIQEFDNWADAVKFIEMIEIIEK